MAKRDLLLVLGLTTRRLDALPDPLVGASCPGSLAAVGAGCSLCLLRALLRPLPAVKLVFG